MARRAGGRSCNKPHGMSLTSMEKITTTKIKTNKNTTVYSDTESDKSTISEASQPSPKRANQKKNPSAKTSTSATTLPTRRTVHHRQSSGTSFAGPHPNQLNRRTRKNAHKKPVKFNIDSRQSNKHRQLNKAYRPYTRKWASQIKHPNVRPV